MGDHPDGPSSIVASDGFMVSHAISGGPPSRYGRTRRRSHTVPYALNSNYSGLIEVIVLRNVVTSPHPNTPHSTWRCHHQDL